MEWSTFWTAVGAVSTAATALGIFYAAQQIRFQAWLKAQDVFIEREFREARGTIMRRTGDFWTVDEEAAAWLVCRRMDELARLAPYIGKDRMLDAWDDSFAKLWARLAVKVEEERERVHWKRKWSAFEELGRLARNKLISEGRDVS